MRDPYDFDYDLETPDWPITIAVALAFGLIAAFITLLAIL